MSADNAKLVSDFCMELEKGSVAALLPYLAEDVVYHNIPWKPVHGHAGVRQVLGPFIEGPKRATVKMNLKNTTVASDTVVMNERLEEWAKGAVKVDLPVLGVFEVRNGKITHWRDYFDAKSIEPLSQAIQNG